MLWVKQYQYLLAYEGVQFHVTDEALTAIADKVIERETGARGLRLFLKELCLIRFIVFLRLTMLKRAMLPKTPCVRMNLRNSFIGNPKHLKLLRRSSAYKPFIESESYHGTDV